MSQPGSDTRRRFLKGGALAATSLALAKPRVFAGAHLSTLLERTDSSSLSEYLKSNQ